MTDEEMAENWYYKNFPVTLSFGEEERKKNVMDIFLAGLKAGKDMAEADLATIAYMKGAEEETKELKEQVKDWKSDHEHNLELMKGLNTYIAELEAQIEKMKCCENCKYNSYWGNELHCNYGLREALQEDKLVECRNMDKWKVRYV